MITEIDMQSMRSKIKRRVKFTKAEGISLSPSDEAIEPVYVKNGLKRPWLDKKRLEYIYTEHKPPQWDYKNSFASKNKMWTQLS